jgi:N6-adenosine-specific RNA methylase IME4
MSDQIPFPDKKYQIIYADPPWTYADKLGTKNASMGGYDKYYTGMELEDLKKLPVGSLADENCVLFLWVTMPLIKEGLSVIDAWGFQHKTTAFTWVKQNLKSDTIFKGVGRWVMGNAELCLLATKGKPKRCSKAVSQIIISHRREHSRKPDEARARIVQLMGDIPRIELFARQKTEGWDVWGNEV